MLASPQNHTLEDNNKYFLYVKKMSFNQNNWFFNHNCGSPQQRVRMSMAHRIAMVYNINLGSNLLR